MPHRFLLNTPSAAVLFLVCFAQCSSDSGPTGPSGGGGGGGPDDDPPPVATVDVDPTDAQLSLEETLQIVAVVRDAEGQELNDRPISWTTSNSTTASVSNGLVTALSPGTVDIRAISEGKAATTRIQVVETALAEETVVVDSMTLPLVSDSSQRADGIYVFQVSGPTPPDIQPDDILVGAQKGGFLRRVTSVSINGGTISVETEEASLDEVIESGGFVSSVPLSLAADAQLLEDNNVQWGPTEVLHSMSGVQPTATGISLDADLCDPDGPDGDENGNEPNVCPSWLDISTKGSIEYRPELDVGASYRLFTLREFHAIARGNLAMDLSVTVEAGTSAEFGIIPGKDDLIELISYKKFFATSVGAVPVVGEVRLRLLAGWYAKTSVKGSVTSGFSTGVQATVGASYDGATGAWSDETGISDDPFGSYIDIVQPSASAEVRVYIRPALEIVFYTVAGPEAWVQPYLSTNATISGDSWEIVGTAGLDLGLGFNVKVLGREVESYNVEFPDLVTSEIFRVTSDNLAPTASISSPPDNSAFDEGASIEFQGSGLDPEDGSLSGEGLQWSSSLDGPIGSGAVATTSLLSVGEHQISLVAIDSNGLESTPVSITLTIIESGASTGSLGVTTETTGNDVDPDGYSVSLDGTPIGAIGQSDVITIQDVSIGEHVVELTGLADNCTVSSANPQNVSVSGGVTTDVSFEVSCTSVGDSYEPDDTQSSSIGADETQTRSIRPLADVDLINWSVPEGSDFTFTIEVTGGEGALLVQFTDAAGNEIGHTAVGEGSLCTSNPAQFTQSNVAGEFFASIVGRADCDDIFGLQTETEVDGYTVSLIVDDLTSRPVLVIRTQTTGEELDSDGYTLVLSQDMSLVYSIDVGVSEYREVVGLQAGAYEAELTGVATNCSVVGPNPQSVRLEDGATTTVVIDVVCEGGFDAASVSAGGPRTCALTLDGGAYCWGIGSYLGGRGLDLPTTSAPLRVETGVVGKQLGGQALTCLLDTSGKPYCWPDVGVWDTYDPFPISDSPILEAIAVGSDTGCGLNDLGDVFCWGDSLNPNSNDPPIYSAAPAATGFSFETLAVGDDQACGITNQQAAYCWGRNWNGMLGDGTQVNRAEPTGVVGGISFEVLSIGGTHVCGLDTSGRAFCWGNGSSGQLGTGGTTDTPVPVPVSGPRTFETVSSGVYHSCALDSLGKAYCWGANYWGSIGDGTTTERLMPTPVQTRLSFTQISAGFGYTCAVSTSEQVYCWGRNSDGQLGEGSRSDRLTPARVVQPSS